MICNFLLRSNFIRDGSRLLFQTCRRKFVLSLNTFCCCTAVDEMAPTIHDNPTLGLPASTATSYGDNSNELPSADASPAIDLPTISVSDYLTSATASNGFTKNGHRLSLQTITDDAEHTLAKAHFDAKSTNHRAPTEEREGQQKNASGLKSRMKTSTSRNSAPASSSIITSRSNPAVVIPSYEDTFPTIVARNEMMPVSSTPSPTPFDCLISHKSESPTNSSEQMLLAEEKLVNGCTGQQVGRNTFFERPLGDEQFGNHAVSPVKSSSSPSSLLTQLNETPTKASMLTLNPAGTAHHVTAPNNVMWVDVVDVSSQRWPVQVQRGQRMLGPNPTLAHTRGRPSQRGCEVFLRHLPHDCFEAEILSFIATTCVSNAPDVAMVDESVYEIRVMLDYVRTGTSRGFAFALMASPELARKATKALGGMAIRPEFIGRSLCMV